MRPWAMSFRFEPAPMNAIDFIDLVARMRAAQRQYFKTRERADLIESKRLEAEVDKVIVRLDAAAGSR